VSESASRTVSECQLDLSENVSRTVSESVSRTVSESVSRTVFI
jgi:hypothetical protein